MINRNPADSVARRRRPALKIRKAIPDDAKALSKLARRTFQDAFTDQNSPQDMALHLARFFSTQRIGQELRDPNSILLLAFFDSAKPPIGYAKLGLCVASSRVPSRRPIELQRLYVERSRHRSGVGSELMRACLEAATSRDHDVIWLGVWERNQRAIDFYRRWRFERCGTQVFRLGSDDQTDLVMARRVAPAPAEDSDGPSRELD